MPGNFPKRPQIPTPQFPGGRIPGQMPPLQPMQNPFPQGAPPPQAPGPVNPRPAVPAQMPPAIGAGGMPPAAPRGPGGYHDWARQNPGGTFGSWQQQRRKAKKTAGQQAGALDVPPPQGQVPQA